MLTNIMSAWINPSKEGITKYDSGTWNQTTASGSGRFGDRQGPLETLETLETDMAKELNKDNLNI